MQDLFKTRTNKDREDRTKLAQELLDAYQGKLPFEKVLFGDIETKEYALNGTYIFKKHHLDPCILTQGKNANSKERLEKRICKCLFFYNLEESNKNCEKCNFLERYKINNFSIIDYEIPSYYKIKICDNINRIGGIDLILEYDGCIYATEVKPRSGNKDSLIHMVAEIVTYTYGFNGKLAYRKGENGPFFQKAIAFFEGSNQENEYSALKNDSTFTDLLDAAEISIFMFQTNQPNEGKISIVKLR